MFELCFEEFWLAAARSSGTTATASATVQLSYNMSDSKTCLTHVNVYVRLFVEAFYAHT